MKSCQTCGMPLTKAEECAGGNLDANFCLYCCNEDGSVKSCREIFEGGVNFFVNSTGADPDLAKRVTRKNMLSLPYWTNSSEQCLQGEIATDHEYNEILKKIS